LIGILWREAGYERSYEALAKAAATLDDLEMRRVKTLATIASAIEPRHGLGTGAEALSFRLLFLHCLGRFRVSQNLFWRVLLSSFQQFPCVDPLALHAAEPSIDALNLPTVFYGCLRFICGDCRGFLGGFCLNGISMCLFGLLFRLFMRPLLSLQFCKVLLVGPHHYSDDQRQYCSKSDANR
jgi:hypothetical protein